MPLLKNTNQPFFPDPNSPAELICAGEYCYPINLGDNIYQQWYQTPCNANLIADPEFSEFTLGAEMITNGSFTGSGSWTFGGNWVYGTNEAVCTAGSVSELSQSTIGLAASTTYRITFDMVRTAGSLYVVIDSGSGAVASAYLDETGSYSVDLFNNPGPVVDLIRFITDDEFAGTIDNVSMKVLSFTSWVENPTWTFTPTSGTITGTACAVGVGSDALEESVVDYITANGYYSLSFTVSNYTAGTITPYVANVAGTAISANGDYTVYITPTLTGVVSFLPSADFVGCISSPDLRALRNDYSGDIIDSDGNRYDISGYFEYYEDKVTLATNLFDLLELTYDCYTILTESIEADNLQTLQCIRCHPYRTIRS